MKILGISGSSREKNTNYMLKTLLDATGFEYEIIKLKDKEINPCLNCKSCHKSFACAQNDDMQEIYTKLRESDIVIFGSPTYFDNVSGLMKNFMDRCLPFYFSRELEHKKVAVVSCGGFKSLVDLDEYGNCIWCQKDDVCNRTVERCLGSMKFFCAHLGMDVIGEVGAIHGDPEGKKVELEKLGQKIKNSY